MVAGTGQRALQMRGLMTAVFMLWAGMAFAQDTEIGNGSTFGSWEVVCDAVTTQRVSCRLVQTQTLTETGELVVRMLVYPQPEGGALLIAQVPIGIYLPGGAVYRSEASEDAPVTGLVWQRCLGEICEAALALDAAKVGELVASDAILFAYQVNPGEDRRVVRVDLAEFEAGLAAIQPK